MPSLCFNATQLQVDMDKCCKAFWRLSCEHRVRQRAEFEIMIEMHKRQQERHGWGREKRTWQAYDRKNLLEFPGFKVDTSSSVSCGILIGMIVLVFAGSVLQRYGKEAVRP